jgi:hypothetical protein
MCNKEPDMTFNIMLSREFLQSVPLPLKEALLAELHRQLQEDGQQAEARTDANSARQGPASGEETPAELSVAQATRFLEGCSEKTRKAVRAMVAGDRAFRHSALQRALGGDTGNVLGGLTKRTRTILGDNKAMLIAWGPGERDENGVWKDQIGTISKTAYESFRKALEM